MIRLGYQDGYNGTLTLDPYFKYNIENAKKQNLKIGVYFYSYAKTKEDAKKQASFVIHQLKDYEIDLPEVYDWESWTTFNSLNLSLYEFNQVAQSFLEEIEKNHFTPMLYSSKNYLEMVWSKQKDPVWLAHYTKNTTYEGNYKLWQLCSNGTIDGIKGYVDIDILYH